MKIAIVTPTFPPHWGGIGNVAYYNAIELRKIGHEVRVFVPDYGRPDEDKNFYQGLDFEVVKIKPLFKYGNAAYVPALRWMLLGFDIIHLHYPFFGGAEVVWRKAKKFKKRGIKIILHYHMDVVGKGWLKYFFALHNNFILPKIIKMVDKVIVTSLDYAQNSNIKNLFAQEPKKFIEVPNGVLIDVFRPQSKDEKLLAQHQIDKNYKIVLFVGGLDKAHYFKGVEYLIEAMSRLRQTGYWWRLMIVGEGELKSGFQDLAFQLGLDNEIIFAGKVANSDLPAYYNLADLVVLPSIDKSEAFGMVLLEAMSCQKPVIATNLAGVRTVVDDGLNGFIVEPRDITALATKINYLLENPEISRQMGEIGRKKVEEKYSWEGIGRQIEGIYKKL